MKKKKKWKKLGTYKTATFLKCWLFTICIWFIEIFSFLQYFTFFLCLVPLNASSFFFSSRFAVVSNSSSTMLMVWCWLITYIVRCIWNTKFSVLFLYIFFFVRQFSRRHRYFIWQNQFHILMPDEWDKTVKQTIKCVCTSENLLFFNFRGRCLFQCLTICSFYAMLE